MPATKTPDLQARREDLNAKLRELQSQHVDIVRDLEAAQQDWAAAVEAGKSTTAIVERRRHCEGELEENGRQAEHFGALLGDVERLLQAKVPHEELDRTVKHYLASAPEYAEFIAEKIDGAHQRTLDGAVDLIVNLMDVIAEGRSRYTQRLAQVREIRAEAARLGRDDVVIPDPVDWERPLSEEMRGTDLERLYRATMLVYAQRPDVAVALGHEAGRVIRTSSRGRG